MDLPEGLRRGLFVACMHVWTDLLAAVLGTLDALQTATEAPVGELLKAASEAGYAEVFVIRALASLGTAGLIELNDETGVVRLTEAGKEAAGLLVGKEGEEVSLNAWQALQDVVETGKAMRRK